MKRPTKSDTPAITLPGYYRKNQAAQYLNVSLRTLHAMMAQKKVPYIRITQRLVLFRVSDLDRALDRFRIREIGGTQ